MDRDAAFHNESLHNGLVFVMYNNVSVVVHISSSSGNSTLFMFVSMSMSMVVACTDYIVFSIFSILGCDFNFLGIDRVTAGRDMFICMFERVLVDIIYQYGGYMLC
mgnify:CR=1 FL=1